MEFLAANLKDSKKIFSLIERCKEKLVSQGINQWNDEYPNYMNIQDDIKTSALYKGVLGPDIVAIISFNENQEKEYRTINWRYTNGNILVIHRLAVDPDFQGLGLSSILMKHAENYAIENNYFAIRLDAYTGNEMVLDLYRRKGYREAGDFYFPSRPLPFKCFEKNVTG